ncbi:MAG: hypothetical protein P8P29_04315 [Flavobacteriaceae bacterium]|nr:hypothetical protein [Flavobacteriaceae bacterium]
MASKYIEFNNKKDFIGKLINIFSSTYVDRDKWLTTQEELFFIECIILNAKGEDLLSSSTVDHFENHPAFPTKSTYIYRNKLKKKKWIIQTKEGIKIHPDFDFRKSGIPESIILNIPLKVVKNK